MSLGRLTRSLLAGLVANAGQLAAQDVRPEAAVGIVVPSGGLGEQQAAGPLARVGLLFGGSIRVVRLRLDAEGMWMAGRRNRQDALAAPGSLRAISAVATLLAGPAGRTWAPYGLLGASAQRIEIRGNPNPYGTLVGMRVGAGMRAPLGRHTIAIEIAPHAVFSDYGTGRDFSFGTYWPVSIGLTF